MVYASRARLYSCCDLIHTIEDSCPRLEQHVDRMQSAFAVYPHFKTEERYSPWGGHHVPTNMPFAGVAAPPVGNPLQEQQQQQQMMGFRTRGSDGSTGQPNTPQTEAKADHAFNHLWQVGWQPSRSACCCCSPLLPGVPSTTQSPPRWAMSREMLCSPHDRGMAA